MAYRVLLADADNTLFDFFAGEKIAIADTFAVFGIPATEDNIAAYSKANDAQWKKLERGETTQERLRRDRFVEFLALTGYQADPEEMSACYIGKLGAQRILLPGAEDFCKAISAHMPIYLVTNGIAAVQRNRFENCALTPYLTDIVISEEIGSAKPDPAMVLEALRRADVPHNEAVMMGDSLTADIPAARNAQVDSIYFTNGKEPKAGHGATYAARTFAEAQKIILG